MTKELKIMYKGAVKNKTFLQAIEDAHNDKKPNIFSHEAEKHFFVAVYYGWLVAQYGIAWKLYI